MGGTTWLGNNLVNDQQVHFEFFKYLMVLKSLVLHQQLVVVVQTRFVLLHVKQTHQHVAGVHVCCSVDSGKYFVKKTLIHLNGFLLFH